MKITSDLRMGGHDSKTDVSTSSAALSGLYGSGGAKFVAFQASHDNADVVHVMFGAAATEADGWALAAGESTPWLPAGENITDWRVIGGAGTQSIRWMWLT